MLSTLMDTYTDFRLDLNPPIKSGSLDPQLRRFLQVCVCGGGGEFAVHVLYKQYIVCSFQALIFVVM